MCMHTPVFYLSTGNIVVYDVPENVLFLSLMISCQAYTCRKNWVPVATFSSYDDQSENLKLLKRIHSTVVES